MTDLLKEAIAGLNINVPIYHTTEMEDGTLILKLYGGRIVHWPPRLATTGEDPDPDPVTTSPALATSELELQDPTVTIPLPPPGGDTEGGPDDLTKIPGIGKATAAALNKAGFHSFRSLIDADDTDILAIPKLNTYALGKIRSYLYVHFL